LKLKIRSEAGHAWRRCQKKKKEEGEGKIKKNSSSPLIFDEFETMEELRAQM